MPEYRYYSADLLTGQVMAELPLYGTFCGRRLSGAGDMVGTYKLDTGKHNDTELLEGSVPGRTAIYMERDGTLIWGGIIWTRTYNPQAKTTNLTCRTFESYFDQMAIEKDFVKQNIDQYNIFRDLITALQAQRNSDIGLDISGIPINGTGVKRTVLVPGYEYRFAQSVLSNYLIGVENGFDYTVDVIPSSTPDQPDKLVKVGYPKIGSGPNLLTYDFPGNIVNYWWPESASKGGTRFASLGKGTGSDVVRAESHAESLLQSGWPGWWHVSAHKHIPTEEMLAPIVSAERIRLQGAVVTPTFELKPDRIPEFESWSGLGTTFEVFIQDARFPNGMTTRQRMIGWNLTVADSDNVEILRFVLDGEDDA